MLRRILVLGGVGLALVLGARYALHDLTRRAYETRRTQLASEALPAPAARRPWETRFEGLCERMRGEPELRELAESAHRPWVAWGLGEARPLNDLERLWVEAATNQLVGLDAVLMALHGLPPDDFSWGGSTVSMNLLRECVNVVCAEAWLAAQVHDDPRAARLYGDALRLAMATDDGTSMGLFVRDAGTGVVLRSARAALDLGLEPSVLGASLAPLLAEHGYTPEAAERRIRRDLALLEEPGTEEDWPFEASDAPEALSWLLPVEEGLAIARLPAAESPWASQPAESRPSGPLEAWTFATRELHAMHARRNVALSALAVAAFRAEHGRWPSTLAEVADLGADARADTLGGELAFVADGTLAVVGPPQWAVHVEEVEDAETALYLWTLRAPDEP